MGQTTAKPTSMTTATTATTVTDPLSIRIAQWKALDDPNELLDLSNLNLADFDGHRIPRTCTRLALYDNELTKIPTPLPPALVNLFIDNNRIRSYKAADLPPTLEILVITKNYLAEIPSPLPPALRFLYASNNRLKQIPTTFPSTLTNFSIHNNYITEFPTLPNSIKLLYASFNEFRTLPESMPPSMTQCIVAGNHFLVPQTRKDEEGAGLIAWIHKVQTAQTEAIVAAEKESRERIQNRTEQIKEELLQILYSPDRIMGLLKEGLLFTLMTDYTVAEATEAERQWQSKDVFAEGVKCTH